MVIEILMMDALRLVHLSVAMDQSQGLKSAMMVVMKMMMDAHQLALLSAVMVLLLAQKSVMMEAEIPTMAALLLAP